MGCEGAAIRATRDVRPPRGTAAPTRGEDNPKPRRQAIENVPNSSTVETTQSSSRHGRTPRALAAFYLRGSPARIRVTGGRAGGHGRVMDRVKRGLSKAFQGFPARTNGRRPRSKPTD